MSKVTALAENERQDQSAIIEQVVLHGDLSKMSPTDRVAYYSRVCESLGLNPYTRPFDYIILNGKLTLYAKRDATDQLRALKRVSVTIQAREMVGDVYVVTARASTPDGRTDESVGAVSIKGLAGDALANAYMKAETKAKRRVTLSIVGLGWLDETEVESVADARHVTVDAATGEIVDAPAAPPPPPKRGEKAATYLRAALELARIKAPGVEPEQLADAFKTRFGHGTNAATLEEARDFAAIVEQAPDGPDFLSTLYGVGEEAAS